MVFSFLKNDRILAVDVFMDGSKVKHFFHRNTINHVFVIPDCYHARTKQAT